MRVAAESRLIAYCATAEEASAVDKDGTCDECGMYAPSGYLVPSEDAYLCSECFDELVRTAKYRSLDEESEDAQARRYESIIGLEDEDI